MPELPDITTYLDALRRHAAGTRLQSLAVVNPFVLRSVEPPPAVIAGKVLLEVERLGKRIILGFEDEVFVVLHLMIAGRLRWRSSGRAVAPRMVLARFAFTGGTLFLTEAGKKRRASLHLVRGRAGLAAFDRGGLEVLESDAAAFAARLRSERHTLKRALTDPRLFSGIGNAYSDEILHRARLSPLAMTSRMDDEAVAGLHCATVAVLAEWIERLRLECGEAFPETVTAFREGMAVHGRYGQPCPDCGAPVQRIRYAANETNYCARCQTGGRRLADRGLSRLLREDWPRSMDEVE
jgi:formamidopyrimidine-DNA glycosylase